MWNHLRYLLQMIYYYIYDIILYILLLPKPYSSEHIINKNCAVLLVHLKEINHNNHINKHRKYYPSPSLEHGYQSNTHISHVISPKFGDQRRSRHLTQPTTSHVSRLI